MCMYTWYFHSVVKFLFGRSADTLVISAKLWNICIMQLPPISLPIYNRFCTQSTWFCHIRNTATTTTTTTTTTITTKIVTHLVVRHVNENRPAGFKFFFASCFSIYFALLAFYNAFVSLSQKWARAFDAAIVAGTFGIHTNVLK